MTLKIFFDNKSFLLFIFTSDGEMCSHENILNLDTENVTQRFVVNNFFCKMKLFDLVSLTIQIFLINIFM